jgi:hypothetical protein
MAIGLVAYIPNQLIIRGVVDIMQGHGKLHYSKTGREMSSMYAYHIYNVLP